MTWFKLDDGFHKSRKVLELRVNAAGRRAIGLWCVAGSWCADELTGGRVSLRAVLALGWSKADAEQLVSAGLWERDGDGYRFHDWDDYQPDASAEKAAARERAKRYRERRKNGSVTRDVTPPSHGDNASPCASPRAPGSGSGTGLGSGSEHDAQSKTVIVHVGEARPVVNENVSLAHSLVHEWRWRTPDGCRHWNTTDADRGIAPALTAMGREDVERLAAWMVAEVKAGRLTSEDWSKCWWSPELVNVYASKMAASKAPTAPESKDRDRARAAEIVRRAREAGNG